MLTEQQIARYSRQIILLPVGGRGQQKLLSASVALVGVGEMATAAALYLAAAGIGELSVIGAEGFACSDLETLNPDCRLAFSAPVITSDDAVGAVGRHDVVVDAGSPSATAVLLNAACVSLCKPLVWGATAGAVGQATVLAGYRTAVPCYCCLQLYGLWQDQRGEAVGGVSPSAALFGAVRAFIGTVQATEVIKLILGLEATLMGRRLVYDACEAVVRDEGIVNHPRCEVCRRLERAGTMTA
jgi:molybdopterin/thiamine biosynthesis adenylyltransferase